ncbi:hypothetical protein BY996DRAFT_6596657 [Phakopsora pachyrhizi]|nr:hypothetical protein BY996DRAFT_6596657 [Phakopsora pachyrhizi]
MTSYCKVKGRLTYTRLQHNVVLITNRSAVMICDGFKIPYKFILTYNPVKQDPSQRTRNVEELVAEGPRLQKLGNKEILIPHPEGLEAIPSPDADSAVVTANTMTDIEPPKVSEVLEILWTNIKRISRLQIQEAEKKARKSDALESTTGFTSVTFKWLEELGSGELDEWIISQFSSGFQIVVEAERR